MQAPIAAQHTGFAPACKKPNYPSPAPEKPELIDSQCGLAGSGGDEANQNIAKNNFCASGKPRRVTIPDLANLQARVAENPAINFGDAGTPGMPKGPAVDRALLRKLGEGKLASLRGYVLFARQEGSESVNCGNDAPDEAGFHDIHIELVDAPTTTDECAGVVAEMIPHHRPDAWTASNVQAVARAKLEVRITGQLFFDSSHFSCQEGQGVRENPKRASLWEIHPIYKFEICKGDCTSKGEWISLDEWVTSER